jgi:hypothetical protein
MFDQELYNQETSAAPTQEGDLFHHYEIKPWEFSPRIYKIIGVAALANLLFFTGVAQTNVMTMRGCESPFVGRVCQVLDMAYVSTVLFGTEREYVDVAYEKTDLGDAEITFISMDRNEPMFEYPPGYFQPEPETVIDPLTGFSTSGTEFAPGIPSNPTLRNNLPAPKYPKYNPKATTGEADGWGDEDGGENPTLGKGNGGKLPNSDKSGNGKKDPNNAVAEATPTPSPDDPNAEVAKEDKNGVFINKRPLRDRADDTLKKIDGGSIDLTKSFKATVAGTLGLGKDGKTIVLKNPKPVPTDPNVPNDPALEKLAQDWIVSVGDAGWFGYLNLVKVKNVTVTVEQVGEKFIATVRGSQPSENAARMAASGLGSLIGIGAGAAKGDELVFLEAAETSADGSNLVLTVELDKPVVQEMIQRKLAEIKSKEQKPNGNAVIRPGDNTAVK